MTFTPTRSYSDPVTQDLIRRWIDLPAPFLPMLHAIQEQFRYLPEEPLRQVSLALDIPLADVFGAVSFYHFFHLEKPSDPPPLIVCGGPICRTRGVAALEGKLARSVEEVSCMGRCDEPIPVLDGQRIFTAPTHGDGELLPGVSPLPRETGLEECVFRDMRGGPDWKQRSAYRQLDEVRSDPERFLRMLKESGLTGRGGAGFPTAVKWEMVRRETSPQKYVVCNADEGEPGCFKDRAIMDHDPHALLEGMALAGIITGARTGIIYLRYEYPDTYRVLDEAIRDAEAAGHLGLDFEIHIRRGAGAYICGEETALLNSLEGKRPYPRERPPFPTQKGLFDQPTVVNNVETLAAVPKIFERGAEWFRDLGIGDNAGTKVFLLSGDVERPGGYEVPLGTPLLELIDRHAGGVTQGRLKAVTMAGISGGFLGGDDLDVRLDSSSLDAVGSTLGAGGILVYGEDRCMVRAALDCMSFFAFESCGKCFPCRIGTERMTEILTELSQGKPRSDMVGELDDMDRVMVEASACGLGVAAPAITRSLLRYWPDEVEAHAQGHCKSGECEQ